MSSNTSSMFLLLLLQASACSGAVPRPIAEPNAPQEQVASTCGDGIVGPDEACDDGNNRCEPGFAVCFQCIRCAGRAFVERELAHRIEPRRPTVALPTHVVCSANHNNDATSRVEYDEEGRLVSVVRTGSDPRSSRRIYEESQVLFVTDSDADGRPNITIAFEFDARDRLVHYRILQGPEQQLFVHTEYSYEGDLHFPTRSVSSPSGSTKEYTYDDRGRLVREESHSELENKTLTFHWSEGLVVAIDELIDGVESRRSFEYDDDGRLVREYSSSEAVEEERRWRYDEHGAVVEEQNHQLSDFLDRHEVLAYAYDGPHLVAYERRVRLGSGESGVSVFERHHYRYEGSRVIEDVLSEGSRAEGSSHNVYERGCLSAFEHLRPGRE